MNNKTNEATEKTENQFYTPSFQTEVKNSILILIDSIVSAEEDFLTVEDSGKYRESYKNFRQSFRLCFMLTRMRMNNSQLKDKCESYFTQSYPLDKDERVNLSKEGLKCAGEWIDHLSEEGVIDFYGGSVRKYKFKECEDIFKLADEPEISISEFEI
jgi:hypothetical protein